MSFVNQSALKSRMPRAVSKNEILKGVQVLVVDNDRDSRYLYEVLLKGCGANVLTVASIQEAIDVLGWLSPTILICETRFYGESINTLTTTLSAMEARGEHHIPAIATTTWITDALAQVLNAGFEGFLLKPIDLDHLVNMIKGLVATSRNCPPPYSLRLRITPRKRQKAFPISASAL